MNSCVTSALTSEPEVIVQDADKPNDLSVETYMNYLSVEVRRESKISDMMVSIQLYT